jgi:hypothetical protein
LAPCLLFPLAMRSSWLLPLSLVSVGIPGCAASGPADGDHAGWHDGKADGVGGVDVEATDLVVDLAHKTAIATIELESDGNVALEVGGLDITYVSDVTGERDFEIVDGALRIDDVTGRLYVEYSFDVQTNSDGLLAGGSTVLWPYFCGNLFPCHSQPDDGVTFTLQLDGVPATKQAVYPASIDTEAPPYMLAWAVGAYGSSELGTTTAGTRVSTHWLPNGETAALAGTKHLVAAFDWFEKTLGPYAFGTEVAAVSVVWGQGMYGGMEHHPYWHVATDAMSDEVTQVHEAAHGWFGDGVRLDCWEDFVLSEGTVSYLAARALAKVGGSAMEAEVWSRYQRDLDGAIAEGGGPAWPTGCNQIDILEDGLFSNLPYMQGAFFYKDVAANVGADVLDVVIGDFYKAHKNQPATMQQMLDAIEARTGFDPTPIAEARLRSRFP